MNILYINTVLYDDARRHNPPIHDNVHDHDNNDHGHDRGPFHPQTAPALCEDLTPQGPDGLFTSAQVEELIAVLERVREWGQ